ncbi:thiamine-phosphate kinase [Arthrobacter pityocampae]|uniref:Thiamine-monophosphate kinase n=1 Tax=Arthrobacter pityocampae TaxID=547334 RepID=A0A2S5J154_9MICC|nr:thiamine-phosphate kinase [Arthrobacter pityocampae]PPB50562.1 thiamine-phosphate kinase [Arthrobacter pityocampae]
MSQSPSLDPSHRLRVVDLSEADLLARLFPRLPVPEGVLLGPGDDAAILAAPDGRTVISIDTLVEDHDFRLERPNGHRTTGYDVGWKCAAQNLSDINAMGGRATSLVVSLTLPPTTPVGWVEAFADGLTAAIRELGAAGCGVVGGDLGAGAQLVVTAAVTGTLDGREAVLRSGAKAGHTVAVTGTPGRAAAGLALLEDKRLLEDGRPSRDFGAVGEELVAAQLRPRPPLALGPAAAVAGASAMLDISDGLIRDAGRIATASGVGLDLDPEALRQYAAPLEEAAALLGVDAMEWVLGGGEDHGLLATFPQGALLPDGFTAVGSVVPGEPLVTLASQAAALRGWDHFAH